MSVEVLSVTLDGKIEQQKSENNPPEAVEKDEIPPLRQLNAALDPVARLPVEISSEIFLHSLQTSPSRKQDVPTGLLGICHAWTDIALATPALWTTVHIHFPCGQDLAEVLPIRIQRARTRPLSISIFIHGRWDHRVSDVLWRHADQMKHLEILDDGAPTHETLDLFGETAPVALPLLKTLTIRGHYGERMYRASPILEILRRAPNIVNAIFHKVPISHTGSENLVAPTLRRLIFPKDVGTDSIFCDLTLPALVVLSLPMQNVEYDDLFAFLKRSSAPLQDLTLGWEFDALDSVQLRRCLRLIPTLVRFRMHRPRSSVVTGFFTALADNSSLLPNLRRLTILRRQPDGYIPWDSFRSALRTRPLEQLYVAPVTQCPGGNVLGPLRELVAHGAEIHIGIGSLSWV
ncbi:hypothetical protein C8R45DRAFT_363244 [Mycena sanguinolenta]|nr:hypothetical protein C8R45DRAFT_363244 [Mycena sanguinolenta]